ncbi:hypothetical protein GQ85_07210 [Rhodococcus rhodochrous]|nr:hypothetical protein GQ85_07210 [Rhodococcus rhodochrous]
MTEAGAVPLTAERWSGSSPSSTAVSRCIGWRRSWRRREDLRGFRCRTCPELVERFARRRLLDPVESGQFAVP